MINSIRDAIAWVHMVLASNPILSKYVQEITSSTNYGPFTEARVLQTYFNFGERSWPTDDATLLIWGRDIMHQMSTSGVWNLREKFCEPNGKIIPEKIRQTMKATRAMLLYLETAPPVSFNENMRFYMVTAIHKPLPSSWVHTPPGGIVTVERMLSVDTPDDEDQSILRPWGNIKSIRMPGHQYHLAVIQPATNGRTRLRPFPLIDDPRYDGNHKFKAPPGTQFTVVRVERDHWIAEPRYDRLDPDSPYTDVFTHIILREVETQPRYVVPECIRREATI